VDKKQKTYSCEDLRGSVYFAPNVLRHCCQRFFVNGEMRGDVEIIKVKSDKDIDYQRIQEEKKKIINNLNNNIPTPCDGCPRIQHKHWKSKQELKIKHISMEAHSNCNARCSYCSKMFYGGLNPNYNIENMLDKLRKEKAFEENVTIVWGGGEPVLLKNFGRIFKKFIESKYPKFNDIRVYSNSIRYNKLIHQYLDEKKIILTTSTDAGTQETFEKVRGVKKGFINIFENLQKYNRNKSNYIIIKYILTEENYNNKEIDAFINLLIRFNLVNCNFEISTDYKFENLNIEKAFSIVYFYNTLRKAGAEFIYFDDHVRKRLYRTLKNNIDKIDLEKNNLFENLREFFDQDIIVWGTGAYANEIIKNSFLFKKSKVAFFVDSKISKSDDLFLNCHVLKPEKLLGTNKPIFIASSTYWQTIYKKILKLGVNKNRVINTLVI
jgi:molybdenum cofactor biosynthesis enzyme MoaA|tara:strand:- start:353 stop:1663 length:1311 start_codon:yes stop_codon:yes gene_type:complete